MLLYSDSNSGRCNRNKRVYDITITDSNSGFIGHIPSEHKSTKFVHVMKFYNPYADKTYEFLVADGNDLI